MIRVTWHFVTIAFMILGIALLLVSIKPELVVASGVAVLAGVAFACWSSFALIAAIRERLNERLGEGPWPRSARWQSLAVTALPTRSMPSLLRISRGRGGAEAWVGHADHERRNA